MPKQKWFCEKCKKGGEVTFAEKTDVMSVVHKLGEDHRKISPKCKQPTVLLTCIN